VQYNRVVATRARLMVGLVGVAVAGCSPYKTGEFACTTDSQCEGVGPDPRCELGFCSFADAACSSGRRFGALSGAQAGVCTDGARPPDGAVDTAIDTTVAPFCDPNDATLVGCWQFENSLADASGAANPTTSTGSVAFVAGKVGMAAQLAAADHIAVADTVALTPKHVTIEAWIQPTTLGGARVGVFDDENQYGFFVQTDGTLTCTVNTTLNSPAGAVVVNKWTHVACTYDGATAHIYVNGVDVAMTNATGDLGSGNGDGAAIAGNSPSGNTLVGLIDQLRIYNLARTQPQICAAAGGNNC
jgi:concanavalin A-like lectin/glucanase superfamily protein